jgi:hypothetical protein
MTAVPIRVERTVTYHFDLVVDALTPAVWSSLARPDEGLVLSELDRNDSVITNVTSRIFEEATPAKMEKA